MRDADDPTRLRRARTDAELDARVDAAIDAWRELGPDGTGRFVEDEVCGGEPAFFGGPADSEASSHPIGVFVGHPDAGGSRKPGSSESSVLRRLSFLGEGSESSVLRRLGAPSEGAGEGSGAAPRRISFVDRVMEAEAARVQPRVVEVPAEVAATPARARGKRRWWAGLGLAAAGLLAVLAVDPP